MRGSSRTAFIVCRKQWRTPENRAPLHGVIIPGEMRRPRVDDYQSSAHEGASAYRRVIVCVSRPRMHRTYYRVRHENRFSRSLAAQRLELAIWIGNK